MQKQEAAVEEEGRKSHCLRGRGKGTMGLHAHSRALFARRLEQCRAFQKEKSRLNVPPDYSEDDFAQQGRERLREWA